MKKTKKKRREEEENKGRDMKRKERELIRDREDFRLPFPKTQ